MFSNNHNQPVPFKKLQTSSYAGLFLSKELSMQIKVKKRNGRLEEFNVEKIHKVASFAVDGISGVSLSDMEMNAELSLYDNMPCHEIHEVLIESAKDLISEECPNYQYVAARLLSYKLRKDIWGGLCPPKLMDHIKSCVSANLYDPIVFDYYNKYEINKLGEYINHDFDTMFTYSGLQQMADKYLLKNRNTGEIYETPQFAYMLIAMFLFMKETKDRIKKVKEAYEYFAKFKINLPTPIMAGVRTRIKQFASCVLVDVGDSLDSITSSVSAVSNYTARRAGIGINFGRVRPINSPIRGGEVVHTGVIPYLKMFEAAVKATSQNGIRGGGATVNFPFWHYEIEDVIVLKNNAGTDDNRARKLDYCIQFSKIFYERLLLDQDITLFSPHETQDMYDAFGHDEFDELYMKYEKDESLLFRKKIKARKLAELLARERLETGRIYVMNIDHVNNAGSWDVDVKMTNLCVEVTTPTKPLESMEDEEAEIGICILSAINLLEISSDADLKKSCDIAVRLLNALIDYQDYPVKAGETFTKGRRSLGIGVTNLAGFLAKNKLSYHDPKSLEVIDQWMEKIQYYLLDSSCKLSEETEPCPKFADTKYSKGLLPIDWYNKNVDNLINRELTMPWEELRERIKKHGLKNSTLSAIMPCESSSVIQNSTNGIEPVRRLLSYKKAKNGTLKQLVPNFHKHRKYYDMAFDFIDNKPLINIISVMQKWVDMSISANNYYNYSHYDDGSIPLSIIIKDLIYAYKYGVKTLYYSNSPDGDSDATSNSSCEGGGCSV